MKTKFAPTIMLTFLLIACGKKTQVKGVVYSKHNIPVPNVSVSYERYRESSYPETSYWDVTTTNDKGEYQFDFRGTKRYVYHVKCYCDSGYKNLGLNLGSTNNIDLYLE